MRAFNMSIVLGVIGVSQAADPELKMQAGFNTADFALDVVGG